jgi:hypothetical protein
MTAITLNLLAEEQQAQVARAHDPLKILVAIGLGALSLVVAGGSTLSVLRGQKLTELQALEARWKSLSGSDSETAFQKTRDLAEEIATLNHSRVLIAPQLAMVKDLVPSSIQLSHLSFALTVETVAPDTHGEASNSKRPARPRSVERLVLRLEGAASSSRPELEVDQFLQTLRDDARFSAVVEDIQLRSISRVFNEASKSSQALPTANFTIECRYKEKGQQ